MTRKARAIGCLALLICSGTAARADEERVSFARDIRPILSNKCFLCHGGDEEGRKGGLRLDTEDGARGEADSGGRAIVPGDLDESELIARITSADPIDRMPPEESGKALTSAEIDLLKKWVAQGGDYAAHWAFVPPEAAEPPAVRDESWVRNEIDRFVLARLEKEGLEPNEEAGRETLIRRLGLDLIGLPPTPEEIDAFVADDRPEAYDELVEKLLASPHHGERWGRLWLDAARYADSDGFEKDKPRQAWAYRDWVIKSLNNDLPYDQFIARQIAGDLMPGATQDDVVATGFLRNSMINEEGGVDPEQFRMEAMFDRMDAVGKAVLGLTIQCAQCHTHKYDPITHEDYYKMFAALNNSDEATVAVYSPAEQLARAALFGRIGEIEDDLRHRHPDWPEKMAAWEEKAGENLPAWEVVRPELDTSGGQKHYLLDDGSILAAGYAPTKHTTEFPGRVAGPRTITAARLELLNDPNLPLGGPGRSVEGLFGLTEFKVVVEGVGEVKIAKATADIDPAEAPLKPYYDDRGDKKRVTGPVAYAIDGKDETAWTTDIGPGRSNVPRKAVFVFEKPIEIPEAGAVVTFKLAQNHGGWNSDDNQNYNLGRFRFSVTDAPEPVADPLPSRVREILAKPASERSEEQAAEVFSYYRTTVPEWSAENEEIESLWKGHPAGASQLVLAEKETPRASRMLERGDFLKPGKEVYFGVPDAFNPLPAGCESDPPRLQFAKWLSDEKAPTTARSVVNRVWQAYFGTGLVETSEDLGSQAPAPSHPELLDWLAADFMANGWSLKRLHRQIAGSATYRQSSRATPEKLAIDPANRLLARGARTRVDAEIVRDIALAASGLLDREVGGPSVYPPAPSFLFQPPASYGPKVWDESGGSEKYRRAMYTFRYRSVPYPMLQAFDAPNGDVSCVRRTRSNTPLQALTTLNEPMFLDCARALARLSLVEGGATDRDRLTFAFRRCVGRKPSGAELGVLEGLLSGQAERFESAGADPWALAAEDPKNPPALPDGVTPGRLAAWTAVARVLLNLDETITKE
jgi:hypothetical protein